MRDILAEQEEQERLRKLAPDTLPCPACGRPVCEITLDREIGTGYDPCTRVFRREGPWRFRCAGCGEAFQREFIERLWETPLVRRERWGAPGRFLEALGDAG